MCETAAMNGFATGRLFEPHTQDFNDKVNVEAIDVFGWDNSAWIGINDKGGTMAYTSSGTELIFQNWHQGYPKKNANDCVATKNKKWGNMPCRFKFEFICEFV